MTANLPAGDLLQNAGARKSSRRAHLTEQLAALAAYGNAGAGDPRAAAIRTELAELDAPAMTEPGCLHPACVLQHPHAGPAILADQADKRRPRRGAARTP